MIESLIMLLIYVCLVVGACWLVIWVLEQLGITLPPQVVKVFWVIVVLIVILLLYRALAPMIGGRLVNLPPGIWVLITITVIVAALAVIGTRGSGHCRHRGRARCASPARLVTSAVPRTQASPPAKTSAWWEDWDGVIDDHAEDLFMPHQPPNTTGLARRLNPDKFYIAMRWDYDQFSKDHLATSGDKALVRAANGRQFLARPA